MHSHEHWFCLTVKNRYVGSIRIAAAVRALRPASNATRIDIPPVTVWRSEESACAIYSRELRLSGCLVIITRLRHAPGACDPCTTQTRRTHWHTLVSSNGGLLTVCKYQTTKLVGYCLMDAAGPAIGRYKHPTTDSCVAHTAAWSSAGRNHQRLFVRRGSARVPSCAQGTRCVTAFGRP
jgi:hypothetical protein